MKTIDFSQPLFDFDGKTSLMLDESNVLTLKAGVLSQIRMAHTLQISDADQASLYAVGCRIATSDGPCEIPQDEYDALKRLCDKPPAAPIVLTRQIKRIVDGV